MRQATRPSGWLSDRSTVTAALSIADAAARGTRRSHLLRPDAQNWAAEISLTTPQAIVPTCTPARTTIRQEPAVKLPRYEAAGP